MRTGTNLIVAKQFVSGGSFTSASGVATIDVTNKDTTSKLTSSVDLTDGSRHSKKSVARKSSTTTSPTSSNVAPKGADDTSEVDFEDVGAR